MRARPFDDLDGPAGDEPFRFRRPPVVAVEVGGCAIGRVMTVGDVDAPHRLAVEQPEEVPAPCGIGRLGVDPDVDPDHVDVAMHGG